MGTFMTFVTPLIHDQAEIEAVENRLKLLKEDGIIREYRRIDGLKSFSITREENKEIPLNSVWFTGMYKDSWPAPPTIEIIDDIITEIAWCSDEHDGGYEKTI